MKRILAVLVAMALLCGGMAVTASAEVLYVREGDYYYWITDTSAIIASYYGNDANVVVPTEVQGRPVTMIRDNAFQNKALQSIVLPETLAVIGWQAFAGCTALTEIKLPESLKMIDSFAFEKSGLREIVIPDGVYDWGVGVFRNCANLTRLEIGRGLVSPSLFDAFFGCVNLAEVTVDKDNPRFFTQDGVLFIRNPASVSLNPLYDSELVFYPPGKTDTKYTVPSRVEGRRYQIDSWAFRYCVNLDEIYFPEECPDVYKGTFDDCIGLTIYGYWYTAIREALSSLTTFVALDGVPRIDSFTLSPSGTIKVRKTNTKQFKVRVEGFNLRDSTKEVTWQLITGGETKHASTSLSKDGLLKIASSEPNQTLQVVAISKYDNSVRSMTTITVKPSLIDDVLKWIRLIFLFGWLIDLINRSQ
ncbi:MAG: leucine-rich repeat domain-containing protein [Firmicutes bacterium]|nr:leucine-rich repeat domain-containing protein [Bacillota bacterium]